jgi:hypothetical protein
VNLASIWQELETGAPRNQHGRMERRIFSDSHADLFATVQVRVLPSANRRGLELVIPSGLAADLEPPASTRMVDVSVEPRGSDVAIVLALEDRDAEELFAAMCTDVASVAAAAANEAAAVTAYTARFERWRTMLQGNARGLGPTQQRGLYGELLTLLDPLARVIGIDEAVAAWLGPDGMPRDFEVANIGVEVKTTATNEPQVATINGERQLDDRGMRALRLIHHSIELVRDGSDTLPALVARAREEAAGSASAGILEDRLLQSGYIDHHQPFYRRTGYLLRGSRLFAVVDGFPRIVETDLRDGIGGVRYTLALSACAQFEIPFGSLETLLAPTG